MSEPGELRDEASRASGNEGQSEDNTNPPPERSWTPETGWPSEEVPPSWEEPEAVQDALHDVASEDQYDAWLDAQYDEPEATEPTPPGPDEATEDAAAEAAPAEAAPVADAPAADSPVDPAPVDPAPVEESEPERAETEAPAEEAPDESPAADAAAEVADAAEVEVAAALQPELFAPEAPVEELPPVVVPAEPEPAPEPVAMAAASVVPAARSAVPVLAPLVALVVVLAALTAFLAVRMVSTRGGGEAEQARHDALGAARNAARLVFSYDYRHLDKDFAAGKAVTTGTFATDYERTTSKLVDDVAARYKAVVVADVSDAAVITASKNRVTTLVFVNQRSTSSLASGQKVTQSRITMVLVRKDGRWLVSQVKAF